MTNEEDKFVDSKFDDEIYNGSGRKKLFIIIAAALILLIGSSVMFYIIFLTPNVYPVSGSKIGLVKKSILQQSIADAVKKNADIRIIRNIFDNRNIVKNSFYTLFLDVKNEFYYSNVSLSTVLEDTRTRVFLDESKDVGLLTSLDSIIDENLERNPFDDLEDIQKEYFENIRSKSGEDYDLVRSDVDKLAKELENKNLLVSKYLNKSNTSFWISVVALCISICIGVFQIYQNMSSRLQEILLKKR